MAIQGLGSRSPDSGSSIALSGHTSASRNFMGTGREAISRWNRPRSGGQFQVAQSPWDQGSVLPNGQGMHRRHGPLHVFRSKDDHQWLTTVVKGLTAAHAREVPLTNCPRENTVILMSIGELDVPGNATPPCECSPHCLSARSMGAPSSLTVPAIF